MSVRCEPNRPTHERDHETDLLDRAKRGDRAACKAIVLQYQWRVFAQLRGMLRPVGRGALVEDLAQETFLRVFRALPRFEGRPGGSFKAWLVTIATRVALNELRRKPTQTQALDTVSEIHVSAMGDPATHSRVIGTAIDRAVGELPPHFRAAFLLREVQGFDYGEIANALDIDLGTVKSRLARARARLRQVLAEADHA